ncbi:MAG TPA: hypothetical protein VHV09_20340 [Trebonia sp.]|jgi:hypothetical protein|nr:hypothetical protein [Trebonia sp.]
MTTAPQTGAAAGAPPARVTARPGGRTALIAYLPAAAGGAYLLTWVAGLAVWPDNLALNATAAQTAAAYSAHPAQAVVQYLLVEGVAGLLLGFVLGCALFPRLRGAGALRARSAALAAVTAVGVSLAQCVTGLMLVSAAAGHDVSRAGDLSNLVNQLDGVKMIAIAASAVLLAVPGGPASAVPRWLRVVGVALAAALGASGYAYLALSQPLAWTAYVSGTLLLLWVTGLGIALTVSRRRGPGAGPGTGR